MKDNLYYKAAVSHFEAQAAEAKAALKTYLTNSVGIGDHSNHLDEVNKWTKVLSEARENLDTLADIEDLLEE